MFGKQKLSRYALMLVFALMATAMSAQSISGNVKDSFGEAVIGATIMEQGTQNGTVSDFDGNFTLKLQKGGNLVISYVGMKTQTLPTAGKSTFSIVLEDDATTLNDVVVVGYGTMKKSDLTGSVSSVNTEQLNAKGAASVLGNLQGSTPGVNITTSGRPGEAPSIEIRGKSSINSDVTPLYVVDGVMCDDIDWLNPQDIEKIDILKDASSTAIYGSRATAGVVMVTTKGGSAVAKDKKATISYDGYVGFQYAARQPEFQNADEFYKYRFLKFTSYANGASANPIYTVTPATLEQGLLSVVSGVAGTTDQYRLRQLLESGVDVDWPGNVTQNGMQTNHYLAVSGGSQATSYHLGAGYNSQDGVYQGDRTQRYNFKASFDATVTKWLSAGFNFNLAAQNNNYANDSAIREAYRMNPFMQAYDSEGNVIHQPGLNTVLGTAGNQFTSSINPLDLMQSTNKKRRTWRALGNVYLNFNIIKGLTFKTTFSPNYNSYREGYFEGNIDPKSGTFYDTNLKNNWAYYATNSAFSWTWDNVVNYNFNLGEDHSFNVMGLYSSQKSTTEFNRNTAYSVADGTLWWNLPTGTNAVYNSGASDNWFKNGTRNYYNENSMSSWAFRLNYNYKNRYLLTATVRWDGSSKFASGNRWGSFPSVALAWRITEEDFMKNVNWLSNLKLRLSYGVTGNCDGIGNYSYATSATTGGYYFYNGAYVQGKKLSSLVDKNLKWEKSYEWNLGLDFGFIDNRINGSVEFYNKTSKDLLYNKTTPLTGATVTTNIGEVNNKGIELSLNGVIIKKKDLNWTAGLTFATNKNEVKKINGEGNRVISSGVTTGSLFVGSSVNNVYGYELQGIVSDKMMTVPNNALATSNGFTPGAQVREYDYYYKVYGLTEGQPIIRDVDQNGQIDDNDRQIFDADPSCTLGFNTSITWKNWDFSMSLYSKINCKAYSATLAQYLDYSDRGRNRLDVDYYIPAGALINCDGYNADGTLINPVYQQTTHYGSYAFPNNGGSNGGVGVNSSQYLNAVSIEQVGFCKIKNITLGYTFPKSWINKFSCSHLRLYCTVTNPFVFTKFKGFDPEWASSNLAMDGTPSTITWQIGASIKF